MKYGNKQHGFTLVELLAVMMIIAILIGFLFPVFQKIRDTVRKAKAREDVYQIQVAWQQYYTDNRILPDEYITQMDSNGIKTLNNPVHYIDLTQSQQGEGFKDYWGGIYQVRIDNGQGGDIAYDGIIRVPFGPGGSMIEVQKSVCAWSKGKKNGLNGSDDDPSDDIKGW